MKSVIKNYTFNTVAKTITLTDISTVRLDKLALITDTTTNKILYNFADSTVATATVNTNVITLSTLQGGENNADKLRIDYDVESTDTSAFADATTPVVATSLPLPTGAATSANQQTDAITDTQLRATPVPVSGTVTATPTGTQNVDVTANTIGLATGTKQDTGNTSLGNIDTKTPALGQALAAASVPVILPSATITTLTPPAAITGFATESTLSTLNGKITAVNTGAVVVSSSALPSGASTAAKQPALGTAGTASADVITVQGVASMTALKVDGSAVTQPVSGTITETNSAAIKTAVETIDNAISGSEMQVDVVGALPAGTNAIGKLSANSGVDIGDVDVTSSVSATLDHGSNLDIDTTAEQITTTSFAAKFGVTVKSAVDNTGTVYIGNSDVTAGTTAATDGFPLEPGESITLPVNNSNLLYAIGAAANQKVFWSAV